MDSQHKRRFIVALGVVSALALAPVDAAGQQSDRRITTVKTRGIVAHEWGVWKIDHGRVAHLDDLARETPIFAFRNGACPPSPVPATWIGPRPLPRPVLPLPVSPSRPAPWISPARKPVIFLTTDRATSVTVEVAFRQGEPWLFYPFADVVQGQAGLGLRWTGTLVPQARAPLATAPPQHWWHDLRAVGADLFLSSGGSAERFLFYDGPVRFSPSFRVLRRNSGADVAPLTTETAIWLVDGTTYVESEVRRGQPQPRQVDQGNLERLRERLDRELRERGLTEPEARSLLETWRDELFGAVGPRAISFVPRHLYDAMLPLAIVPEPRETVRVGLIIESLE